MGERGGRQAWIDLDLRQVIGVDLKGVLGNRGRDVGGGGVDNVCG